MYKYFVSVFVMVFSIFGMNAQELKSPNGNFKIDDEGNATLTGGKNRRG